MSCPQDKRREIVKPHRLANLAQHFESLSTILGMAASKGIVSPPPPMNLDELQTQRDQAENDLLEGLRSYNHTQGLGSEHPVLINGTIYATCGNRVVRHLTIGLVDIITHKTLQAK